MERLFTCIHLSDIHFGHGDAGHHWDQELVLEALRKDLIDQCKEHQPDAVFLTGDVAFSGKSTQYERALTWLESISSTVGLDLERIFVVPGNHDVDRDVDKNRDTARLVQRLRAREEALDDALGHKADRKKLAKRMVRYVEFAAKLAPACFASSLQTREERLFWQHCEKRGRLRLRIIGLNTALLAADKEDKGQLVLGKAQLGRGLLEPPIAPGELVVILSHHPLQGGWLADERVADEWLSNHAHVHFFGHIHDPDSESARRGTGRQFVRIAAGAAHDEQLPDGAPSGHGYAIVEILADATERLHLHLWPRCWSESHKGFVEDLDHVPKGHRYATHELDVTLPVENCVALEEARELPPPTIRAPFGDQGCITDPARFFDRVNVLDHIFSELAPGRNISLVGESQVGKSSVLIQIIQQGPRRLGRPAEDFVYLDMQLLSSDGDFFAALGEKLGLPESESKGWRLKRALGNRRVVLCLDEIEKMSYQGFTRDVRDQLRGLADGNHAPLTLVIASRSPLSTLFPDDPTTTSPLAPICTEKLLVRFSSEIAQEFLHTRMEAVGLRFEDDQKARLITESGGHPGRLQELAHRLWCHLFSREAQ
jgi:hypothetical protein